MLFEEYFEKILKLKKTKKEINKLDNKKIDLMRLVDIQAIQPKDNLGGTNSKEDKMLLYTAELEIVEKKLAKEKRILKELKKQIKEKEEDLRESSEILDKVYLYKYIDNLKYYQIGIKIGYEKTKTYNLINRVDEILEKIRSTEKNGKI